MSAENFNLHPNKYSEYPTPQLLDVTLRDGSFAVGFQWNVESVEKIVESLVEAHVPYIELGYYGGVPELHGVNIPGLTADFPLNFAFELSKKYPTVNFALMIHPGMFNGDADFNVIAQSGISLVRFVYHSKWHATFCKLITSSMETGLLASANLALSSRYSIAELTDICMEIASLGPDIIYIADTCSAFYPDQVGALFKAISGRTDVRLGFHSHDFLSLAFANSLAASTSGASFIDSSLVGIGRGAGNLRTELWCMTASAQNAGRFNLPSLLLGLNHIKESKGLVPHTDLLSIAAGACNLTPPEEDMLREIARECELAEDVVASLFVLHYNEMGAISREEIHRLLTTECSV